MSGNKRVESVNPAPAVHWVGDGFPVSSVFSPQAVRNRLSPYVLMDYAGPVKFEPSNTPRGVDTHPHRGFETVTVVYQGELEHRDSAGNSGSIGPGDVQWMTAASGVLHEEKHSRAFTQRGGVLEMAQLWVNLPAKHKMSPPRYQELRAADVPTVSLGDACSVRVIAGALNDTAGAAKTFSPVILWDVRLRGGGEAHLPIPSGFNAGLYVRHGSITIENSHQATAGQFALLSQDGQGVSIRTDGEAQLLVVGGEPINEPIATYGPFVMNTPEEIHQAIADVRAGKFGELA